MATLRQIRKKIKATKSIQKTTNVMQMISAVRFQKAQMQLTSARPYALKIQHLLSDMMPEGERTYPHPFLVGGLPTAGDSLSKEGLLIITSDKGLCGLYNTNIVKKAFEYIKMKNIHNLEIFVIGKKGLDYFKRNGILISREYFNIFKNFSSIKTEIIADEIIKLFLENKLEKFSIIYAEYKSLFYQPTAIKQLLPIESTERAQNKVKFDYIYEPSKEIITDKLIKRYFNSEVFKILLEAYTSEVASRRNSMENANKNSTEIIDELSIVMNNLRQQRITTELTEIVSASEQGGE
ncbi:MAG: ATP synthase F1 subunit gamma [Elusimicrobiota bacterium]